MDTNAKTIKFRPLKTILIVLACVIENFLGKHLAATFELPIWLDSIGTVAAAYVLGPFSGALVGCTGNIIYSFWDVTSLVYGLTSVFIGVLTGFAARKKYFESFFKSTSLAGGVAVGSTLISTVLNVFLYGGSTGNVWGDGVRDYLTERGAMSVFASAVGELYVDFLDKLVTVLVLFVAILLFRKIRHRVKTGKKRNFVIWLLLFAVCAGAIAAPSSAAGGTVNKTSYIQQVFSSESGLPGGHANDIAATNDGILWVGTNSGLYRYSGSGFRMMDNSDTVKNVNCLYVDQEGRLWIGTNDNGLVLAINGKIVNTLDSSGGLPSDCVLSIVQSANGEYYIGTSEETAVIRITGGILLDGVVGEIRGATCLSADADGNVSAVTEKGELFILTGRDEAAKISMPEQNVAFSTCAFDESGSLWAGTENGYVITYRSRENEFTKTRTILCRDTGRINHIRIHDGTVWVLTENGIGNLYRSMFQPLDTGGFDSSVSNMAVDYQGNLWFASEKQGLLHLSETGFPNLSQKYGLGTEAVNTTCVRGGTMYVGTDHGLEAIDMSEGTSVGGRLAEMLSGFAVKCIRTDSSGNLWVCSIGRGLICLTADGKITSNGEAGGAVYVCAELSDGTIAAGGDAGLALIKDGTARTIPYGDTLGRAHILSICKAPDGKIYLGTDGNGIVIVEDGKVTGRLTKEDGLTSGVVRRIVPDGKLGPMFIVTGSGLCYFENGTIRPLINFPYSDNYDVVIDDRTVFVTSSAGIYVVRRDALLSDTRFDFVLLDHKAGLNGIITENSFNALTANNDLYLSTDSGVIRMNLRRYWTDRRSYRLMVSEIKLDGRSVPIERGSGLTIGRDVNTIEFTPEIVNYSLEDPKISYYLEGLESGYTTVAQSELGAVVYSNLPSGEYTFRLAILDEDTGEVREESTYGFIKEKSIHDNDWFIVYLLLVGGLFVGWLTWFITRISVQQTISIQQERLALALKQVQMGNETIIAIAKTVDAKDVLTSKHSQRVSDYSVLIAKSIGFTEDEQENLRKAALLHDIGKIGIPDSILNKPDRLDDREYAIMKTHVTSGADILKDFTLIEHVVDGARYHHERYDGRGYPDGLSGKNIPLYGRIIAIADAFDAMTANRVYRKRMDFDAVMRELRGGRGTQFDPELLDVFLGIIEDGGIDVKTLYSDPAGKKGGVKGDD